MGSLEYVKGDLFAHLPESNFIITHIVNNIGAWGSGFVVPLGEKFPESKGVYFKSLFDADKSFEWNGRRCLYLGEIQRSPNVINMVAQIGLKTPERPIPLRYGALVNCMENCVFFLKEKPNRPQQTVYAPKFGSDRAGGDWKVIESLIQEIWVDRGIDVKVFYL